MSGEAIKPGTPLPWRYVAGDVLATVTLRSGQPDARKVASLSIAYMGSAERDGNAAYIVHACNEYPALKAKADALAEALETMLGNTVGSMMANRPSGDGETRAVYPPTGSAIRIALNALAAYRESGQ